jgi:hypothetical protein
MQQTAIFQEKGSPASSIKINEKFDLHFSVILEAALKRSGEAVRFFEKKSETSRRTLIRAFYMYLSVKKEAQRSIIEKIAFSLGLEMVVSKNNNYLLEIPENSGEEEYCKIFQTIHEIAADELEFYLNYAAVETDPKIKSFILMLADLSKEFLFDVKIWYLNHKECRLDSNPAMQGLVISDYVVEAVLN